MLTVEELKAMHTLWPDDVIVAAVRYYRDERMGFTQLVAEIGETWALEVASYR